MCISNEKLYAYCVFTQAHAFMVLSECQTVSALMEKVENNAILTFQYPDKKGAIVDISIRCSSIEAIDTRFGNEPVKRMQGPEQTSNLTNRAADRGGRIVLGQQAKRLGKTNAKAKR